MNIFLLFLTTLFMIGYYVIYSPSQNLEHLETENIIKTSDLRKIAECVIAAQNAAMDGAEYDNQCVDDYAIFSQYICTNANHSVLSSCDGTPAFNYIVTRADRLYEDQQANMLKIIESLYQDKGSFGIYNRDSYLMTADISGKREIAESISNAAHLEDGQLVYIMQYQIPYMYSTPSTPGDPDTCPQDTIAVHRYARWLCLDVNLQSGCPNGFYLENNECKPYGLTQCEINCQSAHCSRDETCVCPEGMNNEAICIASGSLVCPSGTQPVQDEEKKTVYCSPTLQNSGDQSACNNADRYINYSNYVAAPGRTLRIRTVSHCKNSCLIATKVCDEAQGMYNHVCLPDTDKINKDECYPDSIRPEDCTGPNKGIYFGFNQKSYTTGIKNNNGDQINISAILTQIPHKDGKFHCKTCSNGINEGLSVIPFVVICN